ncbi:MAG: arginine--tRNA ligase [bacterium]|nr:arginine--tRNA ligase [bacterium]
MLSEIRTRLAEGLKKVSGVEIPAQRIELTVPEDANFGDLTSNLAMIKGNAAGMKPRDLAEKLAEYVDEINEVATAEVAGPGFINIQLTDGFMHSVVQFIFAEDDDFGGSITGQGKRLNLEYISANPTGPLNAVSARAAAYGDSLARILGYCGYDVNTEFYVCDAGTQIRLFGESIIARMAEILGKDDPSLPDDGYQGEYVKDVAQRLLEEYGDEFFDSPFADIKKTAIRLMVKEHKEILARFNVDIDRWFEQSNLYPEGVEAAAMHLEVENNAYEKDGAKWAATSRFGDDEDRVIVRSDSEPTYFLADLAYHMDKRRRGYDLALVVLGPDHHGHQEKMLAGMRMLGIPDDWLEIVISQQVNLISGGEKQKMSKRAGRLVEMSEVIDEIGTDAARFFFLNRTYTAHLDFDLDLAKKETLENPVYYVQYCHARCESLLREASERMNWNAADLDADLSELKSEQERFLERKLWEFPMTVERASESREVHHVCAYLMELAAVFHSWYQSHRVLNAESEEIGKARLALARATAQTIRNGLRLLGVKAPEVM